MGCNSIFKCVYKDKGTRGNIIYIYIYIYKRLVLFMSCFYVFNVGNTIVCANLYYDGNTYFNKSCSCCEGCKIGSKEKKDEGEREGIGLAIGFFMHCSYYI